MKIALPVSNNILCMHFGHCEEFAIIDIDEKEKIIIGKENLVPPPHEPGLLPKWLAEKNVNMIISGGMGLRAQTLFLESNIKVITGAPPVSPDLIIEEFMKGTLLTGQNACDH